MKYKNIIEGIFLRKLNRFTAEVEVDGEIKLAHLPTTARLRELLIPGAKCYLEEALNKKRKTPYTLISIEKNDEILNIVSTVANDLVYEKIIGEEILTDLKIKDLKKEVTYSHSRFDFGFTTIDGEEGFIEVKSVNLKRNNISMFPGSPTERGRKHLIELADAKSKGKIEVLVIVVLFEEMDFFTANIATDPLWSKELLKSLKAGVEIVGFNSRVTKDSIELKDEIEIDLGYSIEDSKDKNTFVFKNKTKSLASFTLKEKNKIDNGNNLSNDDCLLISEIEASFCSKKSFTALISFIEQKTSDMKLEILKIELGSGKNDLENILKELNYREVKFPHNNRNKLFEKFIDK
ncbi:DNA/RNA nuclease SfsA [Peptoniphilus sp.]|uniref:DNA/RNA nuclease SfsA n=1 Tax=Peptoniphilus sp. TaxID=1971214 RepID=UPI0039943D07